MSTLSLRSRSSASSSRRCPQCGSAVKRILRTANDKRAWGAEQWRRYRCRSCDWQGLMEVSERHLPGGLPRRRPSLLRRIGRIVVLVLVTTLLAGSGLWVLELLIAD